MVTVLAVVWTSGLLVAGEFSLLGLVILPWLLSAKGAMVFSDEYAGVIARTPHMSDRRLFKQLLAGLAAGLAAALALGLLVYGVFMFSL